MERVESFKDQDEDDHYNSVFNGIDGRINCGYLHLSINQLTQIKCINRINTPRKQGGLGPMKIPLLSDLTHQIAKDYGVFLEDQGHTLR